MAKSRGDGLPVLANVQCQCTNGICHYINQVNLQSPSGCYDISDQSDVKVHQVNELPDSGLNVFTDNFFHSGGAEFLDRKRGHRGTYDHSRFHIFERYILCPSQVTDKTSGKRVASAGGIEHFLQW